MRHAAQRRHGRTVHRAASMDWDRVTGRILRIVRFDASVLEEVRDDEDETMPALGVAVVSAILAGFGAYVFAESYRDGAYARGELNSLVIGPVALLLGMALWVMVTSLVLGRVFRAETNISGVWRTMGYASSAWAWSLFMFVPFAYGVFGLGAIVLVFGLSLFAFQLCTEADAGQVLVADLAGFLVMAAVLCALSTTGGDAPIAAGAFAWVPRA